MSNPYEPKDFTLYDIIQWLPKSSLKPEIKTDFLQVVALFLNDCQAAREIGLLHEH